MNQWFYVAINFGCLVLAVVAEFPTPLPELIAVSFGFSLGMTVAAQNGIRK